MYLVKIQNILVEYRLIGTLEFFFEKVSNDILGIHSLNNVKNEIKIVQESKDKQI